MDFYSLAVSMGNDPHHDELGGIDVRQKAP